MRTENIASLNHVGDDRNICYNYRYWKMYLHHTNRATACKPIK